MALLASKVEAQAPTGTRTCSVDATNLAFGTFMGSRIDSVAVIRLICNGTGNNNPYSVALSQGTSNSFIDRTLTGSGGGGAESELSYNMYIDPSRTIIWGNGQGETRVNAGSLDFRQIGAVTVPLFVFGRVKAQHLPRPGQYFDSIVVTVTF